MFNGKYNKLLIIITVPWQEADQLAIYKSNREVELGLPRTFF